MKIRDIVKTGKVTLSFELFPPKVGAPFAPVEDAANQIAEIKPEFMSVTYGAGGGTSQNTVKIASHIQNDLDVTALAHLTCVSSTKEEIFTRLQEIKKSGIENILALRGDIPEDTSFPSPGQYQHACDLIHEIHSFDPNFCIGGACYPEGHPECLHKEEDILYLKEKVDCGLDFLTTQMFFDNNILYNFLYKIREKGITVPVFAGIMPVTNGKQMKRILSLSGTYLPTRFKTILDAFGDNPLAMKQAGIAYATDQIIDLIANVVRNIHIYSMNKPDIAKAIACNISDIIGLDQ